MQSKTKPIDCPWQQLLIKKVWASRRLNCGNNVHIFNESREENQYMFTGTQKFLTAIYEKWSVLPLYCKVKSKIC